MSNKPLTIGLFGFGCVGQGLYEVLSKSKNVNASIAKTCVKHRGKERSIDETNFTYDKDDLLNDENINVIVELIDHSEEAFEIVKTALQKGKAVVTANKKMLAEHFTELYDLQEKHQVPLLYEASVCASIPIIRTLEEYYDNDLLSSIEGIFNGTTNYILSKTCEEQVSYAEALSQAQRQGFAESDPTLDVKAYDPKFKLSILTSHAFGLTVPPSSIFHAGIDLLSEQDVQFAREKGRRIKLVAKAFKEGDRVSAYVIPKFVGKDDALFSVQNEFNAVHVEAAFNDRQFFKGKGAGAYPTAAAVLSDISALTYDYKYGYKKIRSGTHPVFHQDVPLTLYLRYTQQDSLDGLDIIEMHEQFISYDYRYLVATVRLSDLIRSGIKDRRDVFIAELSRTTEQVRVATPIPELAKASSN